MWLAYLQKGTDNELTDTGTSAKCQQQLKPIDDTKIKGDDERRKGVRKENLPPFTMGFMNLVHRKGGGQTTKHANFHLIPIHNTNVLIVLFSPYLFIIQMYSSCCFHFH